MSAFYGMAAAIALAATATAGTVTVDDVTQWSQTPVEVASVNLTYLNYSGGVYAGINDLAITVNGVTTVEQGFCVDPFHWSATGPTTNYSIVPLVDAPKSPATLNAYTTHEIEDLWAEYYSPTMSSPNAAALQIAIWELVSSNAVASDGLAAQYAFALTGSDFGASLDLASLATYKGPAANLIGLTGPGQDYVVAAAPDGGSTFFLLAMTAAAVVATRPSLVKRASWRHVKVGAPRVM